MSRRHHSIEVFKYYTLLHSLIKLDFVFNVFFMGTAFYFMHCDGEANIKYTAPFYGLFFILSVVSMVRGVDAVIKKD